MPSIRPSVRQHRQCPQQRSTSNMFRWSLLKTNGDGHLSMHTVKAWHGSHRVALLRCPSHGESARAYAAEKAMLGTDCKARHARAWPADARSVRCRGGCRHAHSACKGVVSGLQGMNRQQWACAGVWITHVSCIHHTTMEPSVVLFEPSPPLARQCTDLWLLVVPPVVTGSPPHPRIAPGVARDPEQSPPTWPPRHHEEHPSYNGGRARHALCTWLA